MLQTVVYFPRRKSGHPSAAMTFAEEKEFISFYYVSSMFNSESDPFMT